MSTPTRSANPGSATTSAPPLPQPTSSQGGAAAGRKRMQRRQRPRGRIQNIVGEARLEMRGHIVRNRIIKSDQLRKVVDLCPKSWSLAALARSSSRER